MGIPSSNVESRDAAEPTFASLLLSSRRAAGLSQEELSRASGVSVRTISELETGRRRAPQMASATLLADALRLTGDERDAFFGAVNARRRSRLKPAPGETADAAPATESHRTDPNPILGRDRDLAVIEAHLAEGDRLLTLLGTGGVGKSRLARAIAERRPALWVDLAAISDPALVLPAVARAAGAADPSPAGIARAIGDPPPLLILDNFEHVVAAAADLPPLLEAIPGVSVLVTTREPLRLAGERVLPVDPLALPDPGDDRGAVGANPAVALFQRTLDASAPSRTGHPGDLADAAEIVTLLDGLPLAIELAAAQGVTLPTTAIATLLRNAGLAALARGRRDGPARFQTMDAAIAWSADILPADAQRLFRVIGLFRGGFTMDALIATVAALGDPALIAALPTLAESQLVQRDPADPERLRMLEPVRLFARDRLRASGEEHAVRAAHARHFLSWAREQAVLVAGETPTPALDALDADLANLLVAFETADDPSFGLLDEALLTGAKLSQYWELRLRAREGRMVLDRVIAAALAARAQRPSAVALIPLMDAVHFSGYLAFMQTDEPGVERTIAWLAPLVEEDGSAEYRARLSILRIIAAHARGEPSDALLDVAIATRALVEQTPDDGSWEQITQVAANLKVECGDYEGALLLLQTYIDWADRRNATLHRRGAATWIGFLQLHLGQLEEARQSFQRAMEGSIDSLSVATPHLVLLGMAVVSSGPGPATAEHRNAAILHGAVDGLVSKVGLGATPMQEQIRVDSRERLAAVLGEEEFAALLAEGRNLSIPAALALARACGSTPEA